MNDLAKRRDKKEERRLELLAQRRRYLEEVNAKAEAKAQAKRDAKKADAKADAKRQAKRDARKGKS